MPVLTDLGKRRAALVDRELERTAGNLLRHDDRLRGLRVHVRFRGGVAHVTGAVDRPSQLSRLRAVLARLAGVHAVWDRVEVGGSAPRIVDLGAGDVKQYAENVGIDRRRGKGVDVIADLQHPLPLRTASVDRVFAVHVLEHLLDFRPLFDECHRVLREHGVLHVMAPHWRHVNAVADPTHVRFVDTQTFKHFCLPDRVQRCWRPLAVSADGASVFADLTPVKGDVPALDDAALAWFFD